MVPGGAVTTAARCAILTIGNELLNGRTVNTNASFLAREMTALGFTVNRMESLPDLEERIVRAARAADEEVVLFSGGLGPTDDDKTVACLARAFDLPLERDEAVEKDIRAFFRGRGRLPSPSNFKQADLPRGCMVLANEWGTAPALGLPRPGGRLFFALPGVPREVVPLFRHRVTPLLNSRFRLTPWIHLELHTLGLGESALFERVKDLPVPKEVSLAYLPQIGEVTLRFTGRDADLLERTAAPFRERLEDAIRSASGETPEASLVRRLAAKGWRMGCAESCTGGLVAARIVSVAGASAVFDGAVVSYADAAKYAWLGVPKALLRNRGAVSEEVALAMAEGLRSKRGLDLAVAVTGVAGPDGGTPEKPVGTVWVAVSGRKGTSARKYRFFGDREEIRQRSVSAALGLVANFLDASELPANAGKGLS